MVSKGIVFRPHYGPRFDEASIWLSLYAPNKSTLKRGFALAFVSNVACDIKLFKVQRCLVHFLAL